jgi:hypothetical protein
MEAGDAREAKAAFDALLDTLAEARGKPVRSGSAARALLPELFNSLVLDGTCAS